MCCSDSDPGKADRIRTGRAFEKQAALFFEQKGFEVLERNWYAGRREIDLIVRKEKLLIFVEVKSASGVKYGHPVERIDQKKISNLTLAATQYLQEKKIKNCDLRFDVVTFIDGRLEHFPDAFEAAP